MKMEFENFLEWMRICSSEGRIKYEDVESGFEEFIRRLKEFFRDREIHTEIGFTELINKIDELAGEKLNG